MRRCGKHFFSRFIYLDSGFSVLQLISRHASRFKSRERNFFIRRSKKPVMTNFYVCRKPNGRWSYSQSSLDVGPVSTRFASEESNERERRSWTMPLQCELISRYHTANSNISRYSWATMLQRVWQSISVADLIIAALETWSFYHTRFNSCRNSDLFDSGSYRDDFHETRDIGFLESQSRRLLIRYIMQNNLAIVDEWAHVDY
jgi:hypothetical protein